MSSQIIIVVAPNLSIYSKIKDWHLEMTATTATKYLWADSSALESFPVKLPKELILNTDWHILYHKELTGLFKYFDYYSDWIKHNCFGSKPKSKMKLTSFDQKAYVMYLRTFFSATHLHKVRPSLFSTPKRTKLDSICDVSVMDYDEDYTSYTIGVDVGKGASEGAVLSVGDGDIVFRKPPSDTMIIHDEHSAVPKDYLDKATEIMRESLDSSIMSEIKSRTISALKLSIDPDKMEAYKRIAKEMEGYSHTTPMTRPEPPPINPGSILDVKSSGLFIPPIKYPKDYLDKMRELHERHPLSKPLFPDAPMDKEKSS